MYYLLLYDVVDDYINRRAAFREAHLQLARERSEQGQLVMAGALADPVDGAVLVFRTEDPSVIEDFVKQDPYVINKLVTRWRIRKWNVVVRGEN